MVNYLTKNIPNEQQVTYLKQQILAWYAVSGRVLPWRQKNKRHLSPYHVWISEIMLQQTTVATVIPYFKKFISKWPTLKDFANASLDEILHMWQGLGYYSRARNLHQGARHIVTYFKADFPHTYQDLLKVPGVGPYTAAAIAAIAFYQPIIPIDGNIIRVFSRLMGLGDPIHQLKKSLNQLLTPFYDAKYSGDLAQALMDLGALICTPRNPKCAVCPLQLICYANQTHQIDQYPCKNQKSSLPVRTGQAWIIKTADDKIILRQRPNTGLLANLWEPPTFGWDNIDTPMPQVLMSHPTHHVAQIHHTFTHFKLILTIQVYLYDADNDTLDMPSNWQLVTINNLKDYALSTLAKKIIAQWVKCNE